MNNKFPSFTLPCLPSGHLWVTVLSKESEMQAGVLPGGSERFLA